MGQFVTARELQLAEDGSSMAFDGSHRDVELDCNFFVGVAASKMLHDLVPDTNRPARTKIVHHG